MAGLSYRALSFGVSLAVISPQAHAQQSAPRVGLSWVRLPGAEGCLSLQALAQRVEARLGRSVFVPPGEGDLAVEARVEPGPGGRGWRAVASLARADGHVLGTRELGTDALECAALDEPLALVLAVMVNPDAMVELQILRAADASTPPSTAAGAATPPPVVAPPRDPPSPPAPARRAAPARGHAIASRSAEDAGAWSVRIAGEAISAVGLQPAVGVGAQGRARLASPGDVAVELVAAWLAPVRVHASPASGADVSLAYGGANLCPLEWTIGAVELDTCAGVRVGALDVEPFGLEQPRSGLEVVAGAVTSARLRWAPGRGAWSVDLGLDLIATLTRRHFTYGSDEGEQSLFRMSPIAALLALGVGLGG